MGNDIKHGTLAEGPEKKLRDIINIFIILLYLVAQKAVAKVGDFVKHTAAKVVKFGLKVASGVQQLAGTVAGFIPGVGKPIGKALQAESKVTGAISDKIHANLGKKLDKGVNVINKAQKIMGYMGRRDLSSSAMEYYQ